MLIGHRYERTPQGDLHIHSLNWLMNIVAPLMGAISFAGPLAFMAFAFSGEPSLAASMDPLSWLLVMLGLLLLPALGLVVTVYTGMRETLLLSRLDGEGKRRTRNFFGRRERIHDVFRIDKAKRLELRRRKDAEPASTQLWLVMHNGAEHRLTTDNVPVIPGSKRTDLWLRELAEYLQLEVPIDVIDPATIKAPTIYRPISSKPTKAAAMGSPKAAASPTEKNEMFGTPARAFCALLGAFLSVLELINIFVLLPALFTGRLPVSGLRTGSHIFYWAEQPLVFSFNLLFGFAEVLVIGTIAWGCLRFAVLGRFKNTA
ncbi:hypothetical protein [Pseudomonas fulva]|uniref:Uncharacterized protein n=1 Tax=Pseudomonas fulva (strain 12-X) TaxID=743720 RepID=F6ADH4_PSEF1|nr:hypothetical protein [Pseudomonas fulva]AEF20115.1 hypothetical protein Psefu_0129 [Pseudomonas fulva 12-X]